MTGDQVVAAYHDLYQVERSFRMTKSDLAARPVFHRLRDSIEAHLTIVFAALAVSREAQTRTGAVDQQDREDTPAAAHRDDHHQRPADRRPTTRPRRGATPTRRPRGWSLNRYNSGQIGELPRVSQSCHSLVPQQALRL